MLSSEQTRRFQDEGYLILRGFADAATVQGIRAAAEHELVRAMDPVEYEADVHYPGAPSSRDAEGGRTVRRLLDAFDRHPRFRAWACSPDVVSSVAPLLPSPPVLVQAHHNCVMTKQPRFSSETGWHQDIRYWAYEQPELVTAWLALTPEGRENGCLRLLPGSHRRPLATTQLDERLFLRAEGPQVQAWFDRQEAACLAPGDLLLFHALTLHSAGRNETAHAKLSLVFTYKGRDNKPLPGSRSSARPEVPLAV
ncbi:MAG: phytanoyl-CoA dioxygenase family protein [Acidiferrobacteraceae bacterium]